MSSGFITSIKSFSKLARVDKPIGYFLLLYPVLWSLIVASSGLDVDLILALKFVVGAILMRSAGCIINDICDREFDIHVKRTKDRVLASGQLSLKQALFLLVILLFLALCILLSFNLHTILLAFVALLITIVYPLTKRFFILPQLVLAAAFSFSVLMVFSALEVPIAYNAVLLFVINFSWTVAYDSMYALVDLEDDLKVGIHSTAVYFKGNTIYFIIICHFIMLSALFLLCISLGFSLFNYIGALVILVLLSRQLLWITGKQASLCFKAFLDNNYVGLCLLVTFIIFYL